MAVRQVFLSAVSAEFAAQRQALRHDLASPLVQVTIQQDFVPTGTETLDKLDDCIRACEGVIHLIGARCGALAQPASVAVLRQRYPDLPRRFPVLAPFLADGVQEGVPESGPLLPYTQWEAWLALYHRKKLLLAAPVQEASPEGVDDRAGMAYAAAAAERELQGQHLQRLASVERYIECWFANADRLAVELLRAPWLGELLRDGAQRPCPRNLPGRPQASFTGRQAALQALTDQLGPPLAAGQPVRAVVLHGLGGVGKTRLALELAYQRAALAGAAGDHTPATSALLFANADQPGALQRHLADAAAPAVLNLPEHDLPEQALRLAAVQRWLAAHPGWLLIADNVDSEAAAQTLEDALPGLSGGQVVATSRLGPERWGAGWQPQALDQLAPADAARFVLQRTQGLRRPAASAEEDAAQAAALAQDLGHLPLALEQAAAYIAQRRLTLAAYRQAWANQAQRGALLAWADARVSGYPHSVATTWHTSVAQLSPAALRLLQRLAFLAPDPVPESLLEVAVPSAEPANAHEATDATAAPDDAVPDPWAALSELSSLSLARRDDAAPQFTVHALVQQVTRDGMAPAPLRQMLAEALGWVEAAFVGDAQDVRSWPVLEPLLPHAREVAKAADKQGLYGPLARLMNDAAQLLDAKALLAEAEPLMRRALEIDESSFGPEHPNVARDLNNLARLLQETNRLEQAEPLMRRALAIAEASFGPEHPKVATHLNNLAQLLQDTNRLDQAEPLMRRALDIDEASFGPEHPSVARDLNNLAQLLQATNRLDQAEPLMRRALAIDEASFGPEHTSVARDLNNLAQLLKDTNRLDQAEPLMRRAYGVMVRGLGLGHPNSQTVRANYLALAQALGWTEEQAQQMLQGVLAPGGVASAAQAPRPQLPPLGLG